MIFASVEDYRRAARRRVPRFLFDYVDGGALSEQTMRRNVEDFQALPIRQRVLRDLTDIDTSISLFGQRWSMPVGLAPIGMGGLNARRGETQAARAAAAAGVPFCLSTVATCAIGEVAAAANAPFWFQLYMTRDRGFMRAMLERAKAAGCTELVFTVDMPVPGRRLRDIHSGLSGGTRRSRAWKRALQLAVRPRWLWDVGLRGGPHECGNVAAVVEGRVDVERFWAWMSDNFDPSVTWSDLALVRDMWDGPLIIKGVMEAEDARAAADLGADGVIVSNHGGRQLDGTLSAIAALPAVAEAVGERLAVLMDGGIRSGTDVARALALGARAVLIGRPWVYALGAAGEQGIADMLEILRTELRLTMALAGATSPSQLDRSFIASPTA